MCFSRFGVFGLFIVVCYWLFNCWRLTIIVIIDSSGWFILIMLVWVVCYDGLFA